jgi:NAD(P)H dehydrogenase (quinone)
MYYIVFSFNIKKMKKVLVIIGHPSNESLNVALAESYANACRSAGAEVEILHLGTLQFDPILRTGYKQQQTLEPDLEKAKALILWSQHIAWFYPSWWGNAPALLKGFIDRVFLPGFAFKYRKDSPMSDKLLAGRTARIFMTMDAPYFWNWLMYGNSNIRWIKNATLEFCGFKVKKTITFGQVRFAKAEKIQQWLEKVSSIGVKDAIG